MTTKGMSEAQADYDNAEPPEDLDDVLCPDCKGAGYEDIGGGDRVECTRCGGSGEIFVPVYPIRE